MLHEEEYEEGGDFEEFKEKHLSQVLDEVLHDVLVDLENPEPWIPTGITRIDNYLDGGVRPGEVMLIAARPGVGKSAIALQIVLSMLEQGKPVSLWSLEMRPKQWARRALAALSQVSLGKIRRGMDSMTDNDVADLSTAMGMLKGRPLSFPPPMSDTTPEGFAIQALEEHMANKSVVLVIDYLQIMEPDPNAKSREQEVARASRKIKQTAMRLGVPIIALAQLGRDADNRVPTLKDLRESGSLEQDADIVLFIHRQSDADTNLLTDKGTLILAKNRDGRTGGVPVNYDWRSFSFRELP
jgi:replicative DNA helicase